jgi:hypothetical protein
VDVPPHLFLRLPGLKVVPNRRQEGVLPFAQRGYRDPVVLLWVLAAGVSGGGTAIPFADLQLLDAAGGLLSLPGGVG